MVKGGGGSRVALKISHVNFKTYQRVWIWKIYSAILEAPLLKTDNLVTKWSCMNNIDKCWISKHSRKFKYTKYRYTKIIIVGNLTVMVLIPVSWAERVVFYTTPLNHLHSISDWSCIFDHIVHTFCRRCSRSQKFSI